MNKGATKEGGVGEMLFGKDYETITATTRQFVESLDRVSYEIEHGEGLLHGLIYDPDARESLTEVRRAAERLDIILQDVQTGEGLLHGLVYDKEERETLVKMREAATRLNNILEKIETGEGTAGLLINDPAIWEDLRRLLGGVERSKTLKFFIERSLKGGPRPEAEKPPSRATLQPAEEPPPAPDAP
jgi:phospholipid/cholesterol/gamma-HCH transport system substrate-binding protein